MGSRMREISSPTPTHPWMDGWMGFDRGGQKGVGAVSKRKRGRVDWREEIRIGKPGPSRKRGTGVQERRTSSCSWCVEKAHDGKGP